MDREIYKIMGLIYGAICLIIAALQFLNPFLLGTSFNELNPFFIIPLLILGYIFTLLSIMEKKAIGIKLRKKTRYISIRKLSILLQFWSVALYTAMDIILDNADGYPLTMVFITFTIGYRYRLINRKGFYFSIVTVLALFLISSILHENIQKIPYMLLHVIFALSVFIVFFQRDLNRNFDLLSRYKQRSDTFRKQLNFYQDNTIDIASLQLTSRELELVEHLCKTNKTNQELSELLGISQHTVKTHMRHIFDKCGCEDRHQLIDLLKGNFLQVD